MKRKNFEIKCQGLKIATCHKWNARHKYIVAHVKTFGGRWEMVTTSGERDADGFCRGIVLWQAADGRTAEFRIERIDAPPECEECDGKGRWYDASHGCSRHCNDCNGSGKQPPAY